MTVRLTDHKPVGLGRRFATRKRENPVAAQPLSMQSELPPKIKAPIDKVLVGFNNKDSALYNSAFGRDAVVIDGIAPYRWTGSNAQARWFSDAEKWAYDFGVENHRMRQDRTRRSRRNVCLRRHFRDSLLQAQGGTEWQ